MSDDCDKQVSEAVVTQWIDHSDDLAIVVDQDVLTIHKDIEADLGNLQVVGIFLCIFDVPCVSMSSCDLDDGFMDHGLWTIPGCDEPL